MKAAANLVVALFAVLAVSCSNRRTEILRAAESGDVERVKVLLKADPKLVDVRETSRPMYRGYTPLHWAVNSGHKNMIELLLANNADVNAKAKNTDWTPLDIAAQGGHAEIAELLIANRADVNARGAAGWTPLQWAAWESHKDVADLLLAKGAQMDIFSASVLGDVQQVEAILKTDPTAVNARREDYSPLHWAVKFRRENVVEVLLTHGADVNAQNSNGDTPLYEAACKQKEVVKFLLAHNADVNIKRHSGETPLFEAVICGDKEIVTMLLARNAEVNLRGRWYHGRTLLQNAVTFARDADGVEIVRMLLAKGTDVSAKDKDGKTPLQLAESSKSQEVSKLLRQHGAKQ